MKTSSEPVLQIESANQDDTPGAQALLKGLDILLAIGSAPGPLRFRDIEERVSMPRASLHRLLAALASRSLIRYDQRKRQYEVGMRVLELSRRTLDRSEIIRAAKPEMARLARTLQRTICLMVLDRHDVFVLDFEDADPSYGRLVRLWPRQHLLESAGGRALLAAMPRDRTLALLRELAEGAEPSQKLLAEIDIGKSLGYAVSTREAATGKAAAAASILDENGFPIAVMSCLFESDRIPIEDIHEAARILVDGARRASRQIGIGPETTTVTPRPKEGLDPRVEVLPTGRDFVGENPIWDATRNRLTWVDVLAPALRWWSPAERKSGRIDLSVVTAGLAFGSDGKLVACGQGGLHLLDPDTGAMTRLVDPEADKPDNRFNTAGVDPQGRIWAGTMALNHSIGGGGIYSIDGSLLVRRHPVPVGMPKNPAFSIKGDRMYLADASVPCVRSYQVDPASGTLGEGRVFIQADGANGRPNGLCVDAEDHLWVTWLGGWAVRRYDPQGELVDHINLPVPMPTNCVFGGPDFATLFVTTTYIRMPPGMTAEAPAAGQLIAINAGVKGNPPTACFGGTR
jgi:sugar lactone lactonase YvrE/DNA-binding IclR family transcriptional regulator